MLFVLFYLSLWPLDVGIRRLGVFLWLTSCQLWIWISNGHLFPFSLLLWYNWLVDTHIFGIIMQIFPPFFDNRGLPWDIPITWNPLSHVYSVIYLRKKKNIPNPDFIIRAYITSNCVCFQLWVAFVNQIRLGIMCQLKVHAIHHGTRRCWVGASKYSTN